MSQSTGVLIFGIILIIVAVVIVGFFVVGLTRRTNQRSQANELGGAGNVPRDPTVSKRANDVEDTTGNFTRSVTDTQDTNRNART